MIRCTVCDFECSEESLREVNATACPRCGTRSRPMYTENDVTVRINTHELRILTIWASNWADRHCDSQAQKALAAIVQRLNAQLPGVTLTMRQEVEAVQRTMPDAELRDAAGNVLIPGKGKPS